MNIKRMVLATGLGLLTVSSGRRVRAATGEVEVAGYGGETNGGWTCGPMGQLKYAGAAANVKVTERAPHDEAGDGWVVSAGASGERQKLTITTCHPESDCSGKENQAPPAAVLAGGQLRTGYHSKYWGIEGGGGVYQGYRTAGDATPSVAVYPQVEARGGKAGPTSVFGVLGFGSPLVTTMQRPGLYTGMSVDSDKGFGVDARLGVYRQGPALTDGESIAWRGDLAGRVRVVKGLSLRAGGAVGTSDNRANLEGSAGIVAAF